MLLNFIKVAFRNLTRRFSYSAINITGLAVGLACTLLIGKWVYQESSYDRHFEHSDRIYRVGVNFYNIGDMAPGPPRFADEMRTDFPQVERATQVDWAGETVLRIGGEEFQEQYAFNADSSFFEVFSYVFLAGNPSVALDEPRSVVLIEELARRYFGNSGNSPEAYLGRQVLVGEEEETFTVTGIISDRGHRTHIPAKVWLSAEYAVDESWTSASPFNYVLLREGVTGEEFRAALDRLVEQEIYPAFDTSLSYEEWKANGMYRFLPMNIEDIYLQSDQRFEIGPTGNETNVRVFGAVALFILLIAAINFINIVTARGSTRAREVGIRKTLGTGRPALIGQFLLESVILSLLATVLALGFAELFLAAFKSMTGLTFLESVIGSPIQIVWIAALAAGVGLLAGLYPAFYLTRYDPVSVLKGTYLSASSAPFRNALVVSQFAISIGLIICAGLVYQQLNYMQEKDLGLNHDNVLVVDNPGQLGDDPSTFKEEAGRLAGVREASFGNRVPAGQAVSIHNMRSEGMEEPVPVQRFLADADFPAVMGFKLLRGRRFSPEIASDTSALILNERALQVLGLGEDPIGARINGTYEVIGVVSDFNYESFRKRIEPTALMFDPEYRPGDRMMLKLETGSAASVLESLRDMWREREPSEAMNYYFLQQNFERLLQNEKILSQIISLFTFLAILISCMGLYGLSSYITEQRTKEIGIRRILGADVMDIVLRLNKSFTLPVGIAIVIAIPGAYVIMNRWLDGFAYKAGMSPWIFAGAAAGGLLIAWLTVSWQSIRAARARPVESLRAE